MAAHTRSPTILDSRNIPTASSQRGAWKSGCCCCCSLPVVRPSSSSLLCRCCQCRRSALTLARPCPSASPSILVAHPHRVLSVAACSACTLGRVRVICTGSRPSFPPSRVPAHSPYHHHPHRRRRRRHQATSTAHRIPHTSRSKYPLTSTRTFALLLPLLLPTH